MIILKQWFKNIVDEVKQFATGKTVDALLPPIAYIIGNSVFGLKTAILLAISLALVLSVVRRAKNQSILYALGGMVGVIIASGFALVSDNAASYSLPKVISSGFLFFLSLISLLLGRPLAALISHLARGWKWTGF